MNPKERLRRLKQSNTDRMAAINNAALAQQRGLNDSEQLEYNTLKTDTEALTAEIAELERMMGHPAPAVVPPPAGTPAGTPNTDALRAQIRTEELARQSGIDTAAAAFLSRGEIDQPFIANAKAQGQTVDQFKLSVVDRLAARSAANPIQHQHAGQITRDEVETRRELMSAALMNRIDAAKNPVDGQNDFRRMSCLRMVEEALSRSGVSVRGKAPAEIALLAMQQTGDFTAVLENVARKQLLAAYALVAPTYKIWTSPSTSPDFKTMSRARLSETPTFLQVAEGGQIQMGAMSDTKETYALATYGRGVAFSRQMLINDDLGAFERLLLAFGMQASRLENKTVYAILTANAALADTVALFHATHSNLGTGVIGNTALDAMFTAMRTQKGLDGVSVLNLTPKYLITPAAKEITARQALLEIGPNVKASDQNMFAGRLVPVADAELDATSTAVYYGAADPALAPGIEYCHLEGAEGPQIVRKDNDGGVLGVVLYAFLDFAAKAVDYRSLYKSSGA